MYLLFNLYIISVGRCTSILCRLVFRVWFWTKFGLGILFFEVGRYQKANLLLCILGFDFGSKNCLKYYRRVLWGTSISTLDFGITDCLVLVNWIGLPWVYAFFFLITKKKKSLVLPQMVIKKKKRNKLFSFILFCCSIIVQ